MVRCLSERTHTKPARDYGSREPPDKQITRGLIVLISFILKTLTILISISVLLMLNLVI